MDDSQGQRTEKPTQRKKQKAREKGKVAKSQELTSAIVVMGGIVALKLLFPWILSQTSDFTVRCLGPRPPVETFDDARRLVVDMIAGGAVILAPFLVAVLGIALVANYIQVGFLFSTQPLSLNLQKINPVAGFKRLFSMQSVVRVVINGAKAGLVGLVFYLSIKSGMREYYSLGDCGIPVIVKFMADQVVSVAAKASLILLALAMGDYAFQRREHTKSLMMSKQEIKEESKEIEGSPLIKSRIRSAQRELARRRMMNAVPTADVVVTNPTEIAVALKYDLGEMNAPTVVAKGKRLLAGRIKEIARGHGVPIFENKALARSLYELVEVGSEIPESLYRAVAEILSYVYRIRGGTPSLPPRAGRSHTSSVPGASAGREVTR
jgi:flagellar biosynthetic protein FlhB